jgi:hypothetical protein
MKNNSVHMAIEIKTTSGSVLKPHELHFWELNNKNTPKHLKDTVPQSPFKFYTDAILASCFHKVTDYKHVSAENKEFVQKVYQNFDHYTELYNKSNPRVKSLARATIPQKKQFETFEKKMTEILNAGFSENKVSFNKLTEALTVIAEFESHIASPLIYNFSVNFSAAFTEKLIAFYSMLYHLRSVVAVDHNAHIEDSSLETVKCDSISDYLPKSDYTVNDALLYWHFKNLTANVSGEVDKQIVGPMHNYFIQYSHNACNLIDQLPENFLESLTNVDLEDALHHVQMDWLLGSCSGLLFKIREELFGVIEGYDKIFWPEAGHGKPKKASVLSLTFTLTEKDIQQQKAA